MKKIFPNYERPESSEQQGQWVHYRTCPLCEATCGIEVHMDSNKIKAIKGDSKDPFSKGYICPKAVALQDLQHDPDRLRHPIKRTAEGWQQISWDEALDLTASEIKRIQSKHGNNALGIYLGNPNVHNLGMMLLGVPLMQQLKTRQRFSATSVDQLTHHLIAYELFGHFLALPIPDIDHTDYFLMLGANPLASNGSMMTAPNMKQRLRAIQERGGKVVLIDPRRTETADVVSQHYPIRPNTDVLLLLGMLHVIASENLFRSNQATTLAIGLDKWPNYVKDYAPERVAPITGIEPESIRQLAREFAQAKTAICYGRMGVSVQPYATLTQYLITLLNLVTGRLDEQGGLRFTQPAADIMKAAGRGSRAKGFSRVSQLPGFSGEYPASILAEEILTPGDGQIKALIVNAGNPVVSTPQSGQLEAALDSLEFMVSLDMYINETNKHATLILPVAAPLERPHYDLVFNALAVRNVAKWSRPLFAVEGQAKHDWQIYAELIQRLMPSKLAFKPIRFGLQQLPKLGLAPILAVMFKIGPHRQAVSLKQLTQQPHGIDLGALQASLPNAIWHKDKKIHLNFDFFMKDLARIEKDFFAETLTEQVHYPYLLIGRRHVRSNNSWLHNSYRLVKGKSRCTLLMHSTDATILGVADQQWVQISSKVGQLSVVVEYSDDMMPGVVSLPHGWGHAVDGVSWSTAKAHAGVNINHLMDHRDHDPLSGVAVLNGIRVAITPLNVESGTA